MASADADLLGRRARAGEADDYKPTKRGGGGPLKVLWWQGADAAQSAFRGRHQGPGRLAHLLRAARRLGPGRRPVSRCSPPRFPSRENGGLAKDGKSVTWKLKQGVHVARRQAVHRRRRRVQLGIRHRSGDRRRHHRQPTRTSRSRRSTTTRCASLFDKPTPFWADAFVGVRGMIIPKHLFADYSGAKSRDAPANLKPVGTGPYKFVDFKPGDMVRGEINPNYHIAEPAALRHDRDEGRRRRGLGRARGAADRRIRLRLEHAGRGRDPAAAREGRQGQGRSSSPAATSSTSSSTSTDPWTEVDGERASVKTKHPTADRPGGAAGARPAGRPQVGPGAHLRPHRRRHRQLPQQPASASARRTRSGSSTSTRRTRSWRTPAGRRAPTASAPRTARS